MGLAGVGLASRPHIALCCFLPRTRPLRRLWVGVDGCGKADGGAEEDDGVRRYPGRVCVFSVLSFLAWFLPRLAPLLVLVAVLPAFAGEPAPRCVSSLPSFPFGPHALPLAVSSFNRNISASLLYLCLRFRSWSCSTALSPATSSPSLRPHDFTNTPHHGSPSVAVQRAVARDTSRTRTDLYGSEPVCVETL